MSRVLVSSSPAYNNLEFVCETIRGIEGLTALLHGGGTGPDQVAETTAIAAGAETVAFFAAWAADGDDARAKRNDRMFGEGRPDRVVAFWDGQAAGVRDAIEKARAAGLPLVVYGVDKELVAPDAV